MKDVKQFMETMTGKIVVIVAILVIGLFVGSKFSNKKEPIAQIPIQDEIPIVESTVSSPVAVAETNVIQKDTVVQNKIVTTPKTVPVVANTQVVPTTPISSNKTLQIDGLSAIRVSGGLQDNWDADVENDGPVLEVVYLDKNGDIITSDATEKMLITADVKLYAGSNSMSKNDKLVYTQHFNSDQIIFGGIYPKIRIPEEKINVNPNIDYKYGKSVITIHTPNQGDFSGTGILTVLYE